MQHTSDVAPGARSHWRRKRLFKLDLKQGKRDGEERESRDSAAVPSLVISIGARPQSETRQYNKKNKKNKKKTRTTEWSQWERFQFKVWTAERPVHWKWR